MKIILAFICAFIAVFVVYWVGTEWSFRVLGNKMTPDKLDDMTDEEFWKYAKSVGWIDELNSECDPEFCKCSCA